MSDPTGFADSPAPFAAANSLVHATLGQDGRLLIPAAVRDAAGIKRGDKVMLRVEDGRIVVESFRASMKRVQEMLAYLKVPGESVVDQFIVERRAESLRESDE